MRQWTIAEILSDPYMCGVWINAMVHLYLSGCAYHPPTARGFRLFLADVACSPADMAAIDETLAQMDTRRVLGEWHG